MATPGVAGASTGDNDAPGRHERSGRTVEVVVRERPDAGDGPEYEVDAVGGRVGLHIHIIDGFVATVPSGSLHWLRGRDDIASVIENRAVHLSSYDGFDPVVDNGSTYNVDAAIGATSYWAAGYAGAGVDVALIDSGVAKVDGIESQLVYGPDYSFEMLDWRKRNTDTFGHGTHMAGLIAGHDDAAADSPRSNDANHFLGVAPGARVVSLKVADENGASDVVQVLLAIDWVVHNRNRNGFNIRVLNMSFGTDGTQDYRIDPLTYAAEAAWQAGIFVVVAGGNTGQGDARLNDPAYDPYVLAVGADDTKGTAVITDDQVASFSAKGTTDRHPDLLTPGQSLVSLRSPGSTIADENPQGLVGTRFLRGSGTSQAAAVASGAAALVAQQRPWATPDQLKALLMGTATALPKADKNAQGSGLLNLRNALYAATPKAVQTWIKATGTGSLELTRGSAALKDADLIALTERIADGDLNALTLSLTANRWSSNRWSSNRWSSNRWSSNRWSSDDWK
jgi:serine protease AprX